MKKLFALGLVGLSTVLGLPSSLQAQVPQLINYQGRLLSGTNLVNGNVGLSLRLFNVASNGVVQYEDSNSVTVVDGLYSTFIGDNTTAGNLAGALTNAAVWVEVAVNGTALSPRERVAAGIYALIAGGVTNGAITAAGLASGAVSGDKIAAGTISNANLAAGSVAGTNIANGTITAANLNVATFSNAFWQVTGNAGTVAGTHFLGSTDNQPLEIRANNLQALLIVPSNGAPNMILGASQNAISTGTRGASILGGSNNTISAASDYSAIAGGRSGAIQTNASWAFLGGGDANTIQVYAIDAFLGGGNLNSVGGSYSFLGGGANNSVQDSWDFLGGGSFNSIQLGAYNSLLGGGQGNHIQANSYWSFLGGGFANNIQSNSPLAALVGGSVNNIQAGATNSFLGGGYHNTIHSNSTFSILAGGSQNDIQAGGTYSFLGGGIMNSVQDGWDFLGGGFLNNIQTNSQYSVIVGGNGNAVQPGSSYSAIGGGNQNVISNSYATVPGGYQNTAGGLYSFAAGSRARANHGGSFVWADNSTFQYLDSTAPNQFLIRASGGLGVGVSNPGYTADFGGRIRIRGDNVNNSAGMWLYNTNTANDRAFIGLASAGLVGFYGTAGAGFGLQMNVTNGYVGIGGVAPTSPLQMASGASCTVGGVWTSVSDKNRKENFAAVNADDVLAKIAALPITQWNFKAEPGIAHIGPMAQDFHAAFNLGTDDKHIASVDEDGVALAAIQALNAEVRGQKSEVSKLKAENAELRARLDALEKK